MRRVNHWGDVIDILCHPRYILGDVLATGGRNAKHRNALKHSELSQDRLGLAKEVNDYWRRVVKTDPGYVHTVQPALGSTHVVPKHIIDARFRRFPGNIEVVLLDAGILKIGEATVFT